MEKQSPHDRLQDCHTKVDTVHAPAVFRDLKMLVSLLVDEEDEGDRWAALISTNPNPSERVVKFLIQIIVDGDEDETTEQFLLRAGRFVRDGLRQETLKLFQNMDELTSYLTIQMRQLIYQVFIAASPQSRTLCAEDQHTLKRYLTRLFSPTEMDEAGTLVTKICHQIVDMAFTLYQLEMAVYKTWKF